MKIDERLRLIIIAQAKIVRDELLDTYVVSAPDIPLVRPEEQMLTKICALVAACESITAAAEQLNERLSPPEVVEEEEEENKEWN